MINLLSRGVRNARVLSCLSDVYAWRSYLYYVTQLLRVEPRQNRVSIDGDEPKLIMNGLAGCQQSVCGVAAYFLWSKVLID